MFVYLKDEILCLKGECFRSSFILALDQMIKMPYGNIYPIGEKQIALVPELIGMDADVRKKVLEHIQTDGLQQALAIVIDSKRRLFLLTTGDRFINHCITLTPATNYANHWENDHAAGLQTAMQICESVADVAALYAKQFRHAPYIYEILSLPTIIEEMISEKRTHSLLDYLGRGTDYVKED